MIITSIKRRSTAALFFSIFFYLNILQNSSSFSQTTQPFDSTKINKIQIQELIEELNTIQTAIVHAKNAINTIADSSLFPDLLFQLSELEFLNEKLNFELSMIKFDLKSNLYHKGMAIRFPREPLLTYKKTIRINKRIIKDFPDVPFYNAVLYRSATCFFEIGKKDSAKQIFRMLINTESDSTLLAEVIFRLAECSFDAADFKLALRTYQRILNSWDSQFFAMALYKIAWCHYKMNNIADAIGTFYYLLSDINLLEKVDTELLGKSQIDLKREVIDYIAISFCDFGGVQALVTFINKMGETQYTPDFLFKMGEVYLKRDFYADAIDAYDRLIRNHLSFKNLPTAFLNIFDCYKKNGDMKNTFLLHDLCVLKCGNGSHWQAINNTSEDKELFDNTTKELKYKTATPFLTSADSSFAFQNFKLAAKKYANFLKTFPSDQRTAHAQYCLGECLYSLRDYSGAAKRYEMLVEKYPDSELVDDAAYNFIVCFDRLFINSKTYSENDEPDQNSEDLIQACAKYLKWLPKSEKAPEIKMKMAEIFFRSEKYDLGEKYTRSALKSFLKTEANEQQKVIAINLLAQIKFKQENYSAAKKWYTALMLQKPDSTALIQKSKKMIASSDFKIGEQLIRDGKNDLAAIRFEKAANTTSDIQITQQALFEAGVQFEKSEQLQRAALNYETLYKKYPQSNRGKEAIYRAAVLRGKLEQHHLAARNFLQLNGLLPKSNEGANALFSAGLAYEKSKDWESMSKTFTRYLNEFPHEYDRILEAMFKVAFANEQKNSPVMANLWYRKLLRKFERLANSGQYADEYFAARATFRLGGLKNSQFQTIKLKPPLQHNLKNKQKVFNEMMKLYVNVTEFNIAEWTTAAFYRIGLAYEEFCQDIFTSSTPPDLSKEQQNLYWETIQQQWILPLQMEAFKYHKMNEHLSAENSIDNDWVEKSHARIIFLNRKLAGYLPVSGKNHFQETASQGIIKKTTGGRSL